ncbi:hypothetical protein [Streptomyces clavifer]|uniref:hypothetical protein n=1 Tax=Streptomyces clavifer TaxID=68188 RepID=UPI0038248865
MDDLLAAGFRLHVPASDSQGPASIQAGMGEHVQDEDDVAALRAELAQVRNEHAQAVTTSERGRQLAEAKAEHLRKQLAVRAEHIADLQQVLRALMLRHGEAVQTGR